jgi:RNase H-fold protein (predicted Holliday junction resolvase)
MRRIQEIVKQEGIDRLVVGVPKPLKDRTRETDQAKEIRGFMASLREKGFDVVEEDETWSSAIAARQVEEMGRRGKRDDLAAMAILQTYLDRMGRG